MVNDNKFAKLKFKYKFKDYSPRFLRFIPLKMKVTVNRILSIILFKIK